MSYERDRLEFVATMAREGMPVSTARLLLRAASTIHRLAELACSSEAADRDRIKCPADVRPGRKPGPCLCDYDHAADTHSDIPRIRLQDYRAEQRAIEAVPAGWRIVTEGDPRGFTLCVIPPSYAERNAGQDRHNLSAIGVPGRDPGFRF